MCQLSHQRPYYIIFIDFLKLTINVDSYTNLQCALNIFKTNAIAEQ